MLPYLVWLSALVIIPVYCQITVNPACDMYQPIYAGQTYYVYNQQYPNNYPANTRCRWSALVPVGYRVKLDCSDVNIPFTINCAIERLAISVTGNSNFVGGQNYCGVGTSSFVSIKTAMTIGLFAEANAKGGRISCSIYAIIDNTPPVVQPTPPICDCGWRNRFQSRVVGGTVTGINEWPFAASLIHTQKKTLFCGATIIHPHYAISAAHCFIQNNDASVMVLLVGDHDISSGVETNTAAMYPLQYFYKHLSYNSGTKQHDIAIVRTKVDMTFSYAVGPICLPFKYTDAIPPVNSQVTILGWGTTEFTGPQSNVLLAAILSTVSNPVCQQEYLGNNQIYPTQICIYADGRDACQSDSGGPLAYLDSTAARYFLVGLISYGIGCNLDYPSVNTRITSYMSWIITNTQDATYCVK